MPGPVIVHIPVNSHQQRQRREEEEAKAAAELRRQELENRYLDDGWACYEVPPDPPDPPPPAWVVGVVCFLFIISAVGPGTGGRTRPVSARGDRSRRWPG